MHAARPFKLLVTANIKSVVSQYRSKASGALYQAFVRPDFGSVRPKNFVRAEK